MGIPRLAVTPDLSERDSETSVEGYSLMLQRMQETIRNRFPGVMFHVGSLYDGLGGGFTSVNIQGEYVSHTKEMFPDAVVTAMSQEDYLATREQADITERQAA